jgi:hypothetical protein
VGPLTTCSGCQPSTGSSLFPPHKAGQSTPKSEKNDGMTLSTGKPVHGIARLWLLAHRRVSAGPSFLGLSAGTDPTEVEQIEALLAAVGTDRRDFALRLSSRLGPLVRRGVPPRVIEGAPVPRAARLRFADGTTVLVKVTVPGELGTLAVIMRRGSLMPAAFSTDRDGSAHLLLSCPGEHRRVSLHVVGLDQPD